MSEQYCKVLIVDDESLIRQGIKHYVNWEQEGFSIIGEAANGIEALERIKQDEPHIVITDMVMPLMDGEALTKAIKKDYPRIEVIILSSFGDFEYVRSTFQSGVADYILKPKLDGPELIEALKRAANRIPHLKIKSSADQPVTIRDMIQQLLAGREVDYDQKIVKMVFPYDRYFLLAVDRVQREAEGGLQSFNEFETNLLTALSDYPYEVVIREETSITYVINFAKDDKRRLIDRIRPLTTQEEMSVRPLILTLSEPFSNLSHLKNYLQEDLGILRKYHFYFPDQLFFMNSEMPPLLEAHSFDLNHFIDIFKRQDFDEAFDYLAGFVEYLSDQYTRDEYEFKSTIGNILFNITILLGNLHYNNEGLEKAKYHYFTLINESTNVNEVISHLDSFMIRVKEIIQNELNDPAKINMQRLLDYIDQHYNEAITLTDLAEHFHFNASYLSAYFGSHHSMGFNEYLTHIRIEHAKEYLHNKRISISEISGLVGYSDHSYFCKVFKKMTGMSPSKYRKNSSL